MQRSTVLVSILLLSSSAFAQGVDSAPTPVQIAPEDPAQTVSVPPGNFFTRLARAYHDDWHPDPHAPAPPASAAPRL